MRKILIISMLLSFIAAPCFAIQRNLANDESVKVYDKYGSYQGKYQQYGNKTKVYDKTGSYQGYSTQSGNKVKYYNKYGGYEGYSKKK